MVFSSFLLALLASYSFVTQSLAKPNIVFILSDDQDLRLGSMNYMETVRTKLAEQGASFVNHHTTTAQCCPSRVSLLRGQAAHNTNVTNVFAPGGNYEKFVLSGQVNDYLPHWLKKAGYRTEYLGKFLNGVNILNWATPPKGWDFIDYFMEPYQTTPNRVVMSENGNHPVAFLGYHQTDVIRAKALARLEELTAKDEPFFLFISPTAPHVDDETGDTVPCARHAELFLNATAPRTPSFNPSDEVQQNKVSWIKKLERMNEGNVSFSDLEFRRRAQALIGIDEMVADIMSVLEDKNILDETFVIYTSDNGYHLGQHRMAVGKATPYVEDTNLPFIVRGPGVPQGVVSKAPQAHLDLAPTFLEIAGLSKEDLPPFLDGRSLLSQWKAPTDEEPTSGQGSSHEILNVEYWGGAISGTPDATKTHPNTTYKSLRIVGDEFAFLYSHWCWTNEVELYNTNDDPYEIRNLALEPDDYTSELMKRLNALLLTLLGQNETAGADIRTLKQAMNPQYDQLFDSFPTVNIAECIGYQYSPNERPFWPPEAESILGSDFRNQTPSLGPSYKFNVQLGNDKPEGGAEQRHSTLEEILAESRKLTAEELDPLQPRRIRP